MLAVMGLKLVELEKYIAEINKEKGVCEIANDNSDGQVILSGNKPALDEINLILGVAMAIKQRENDEYARTMAASKASMPNLGGMKF